MESEPQTIRELFFYIEGEFENLRKEVKNVKKFSYWVAGIISLGVTSISIAIIKNF